MAVNYFGKRSVLGVWLASEYTSEINIKTSF